MRRHPHSGYNRVSLLTHDDPSLPSCVTAYFPLPSHPLSSLGVQAPLCLPRMWFFARRQSTLPRPRCITSDARSHFHSVRRISLLTRDSALFFVLIGTSLPVRQGPWTLSVREAPPSLCATVPFLAREVSCSHSACDGISFLICNESLSQCTMLPLPHAQRRPPLSCVTAPILFVRIGAFTFVRNGVPDSTAPFSIVMHLVRTCGPSDLKVFYSPHARRCAPLHFFPGAMAIYSVNGDVLLRK